MKYYSEEIVKKLLDGMGPRELKFCPSIEISENYATKGEEMKQPIMERIEIVRKLNEAAEAIRKELSRCREDRENFSTESAERVSLDGRIDGLLISLRIVEEIRNRQADEWYADMRNN